MFNIMTQINSSNTREYIWFQLKVKRMMHVSVIMFTANPVILSMIILNSLYRDFSVCDWYQIQLTS